MKNLTALLSVLITVFMYPQRNLDFEFDYAQFSYDSTSNYVEFYYSFNQAALQPVIIDSQTCLEGILKIFIQDSTSNDTIIHNQWSIKYDITDTSSRVNQSLIGVVGFILPKGTLITKITGLDSHKSENYRSITEYLHVNPIMSNDVAMSDIQLASRIIQDSPNKESIFYKNSMEIFPIPSSVFGEYQPVVFYYSELYNLLKKHGSEPFKLIASVHNSKGKIVFSKSKPISRLHDSRVEVGSIIVNKYPTDTYTFVLALIDSAFGYGVSSSKRFYVFNPSIASHDTVTGQVSGVFASEFGVMADEELDDLFNKSKYIASSAEIDKYDKINTTEGKREFLYNFWKERDKDPSTMENEFYKLYLSKIALSNQRYGSLSRVGWKSDRGRVFILYGEPSEIERYPNQVDTKPYEIWHYNELEGGVIFVFGDLTGFSDYTLLHSTLRGELRDDNWLRRITTF